MSINELKFRQSQTQNWRLLLSILLSGFLSLFSFYTGRNTLAIGLLVVSLAFIIYFARSITELVIITDSSISVTHNFRTQKIDWNSITQIKPKWQGFLLGDSNEEMKVFVSSLVIDPWQFINIVAKKRSNILLSEKTVFYENPIAMIVFGTGGIWMIYYSVKWIIESPELLLQKIAVLFIGLGYMVLIAFFYKIYVFDGDKFVVRSLGKSRTLHSKIIEIHSSKTMFWISTAVHSVTVDHLIGGLPSFLMAFYCWIKNNEDVNVES